MKKEIDAQNYWMQIERLERLIRAAELKAGLVFSFHSLILGICFEKIDDIQNIIEGHYVYWILSAFWVLFVLLSIYYSFKCFRPKMELKYDKNVFFFKDAAYNYNDIKNYSKELANVCADNGELVKQLGEQIHIESKIIDHKFVCVHKSIKYFGFSFLFVVLLIISWIIQMI